LGECVGEFPRGVEEVKKNRLVNLHHCSSTNWVKDEYNKLYFGEWLSKKCDLKFRTEEKV
jgi:hypothetical protein